MIMKHLSRLAAAMGLCLAPLAMALAAPWPDRPVRIIVPAAAGGATDVVARILAQQLAEQLKQPFVVENRAGGAGIIGTEAVARAPADGHTLLMGAINHAINPALHAELPYDSRKDFTFIARAVSMPNVLVVNPAVPARSVSELITYAKAHPGELVFASSGNGTSQHLAGELFKLSAQVDFRTVPYKGSAPAVVDLLGGHVSMMFDNLPSALPHIRSGRVHALGVTSAQRSPVLPDVPSIAESGVPGYDVSSWLGLMGPAGMPSDIVQQLYAQAKTAFASQEVKDKLLGMGAVPNVLAPAEFTTFYEDELARWADVVARSGARIE
jgi:tripartite-type tricarboxylate transporter receptor subunit TctC